MTLTVPLSVYAQRRAHLAAQLGDGGIAIVPTAPERMRNRDSDYAYRHDSYFHYLTGFTEPNAWLVLTALGVELAAGWGVLTFLLNFIPTVGSIIATIILRALPEVLRQVADYRMLAYSVLLIVIMLLNSSPQFAVWKGRWSLKALLSLGKTRKEKTKKEAAKK